MAALCLPQSRSSQNHVAWKLTSTKFTNKFAIHLMRPPLCNDCQGLEREIVGQLVTWKDVKVFNVTRGGQQ